MKELQRNLPVLILTQFILEVITKSKSWEVDVGCSCLLHQSKWHIINWDALCFCQRWGGCWFWNPKPVLECWEKMRFWGVCSHPYHNLIRFLCTPATVKAEHALISWDIAQVKLKASLLSLLQWLRWHWLLIKTTFHYYSSSWKEQGTVTNSVAFK